MAGNVSEAMWVLQHEDHVSDAYSLLCCYSYR